MNTFQIAKSIISRNSIKDNFIHRLNTKRYTQPKNIDSFLKLLVKKKYIKRETYLNLYQSSNSNENNKLIKASNIIHKNNKTDEGTYVITNKKYIDYENVNIDGIEYYYHKNTKELIDSSDFRKMGHWCISTGKPLWNSIENEIKHNHNPKIN